MTDVRRSGGLRRLGRLLSALVGRLLILAGVLTLAVPLLAVGLFVADRVSRSSSGDASKLLAPTAGCLAAGAVLLALGIRLVRGRRRLVLFLRRFGLSEATEAVTFAVTTSLGRSWRLVTLDDSRVAPVGTPRGGRRLSALAVVVAVVVVGGTLAWLLGGGFQGYVRHLHVEPSGGPAPTGGVSDAIGRAIGQAIAAGLVIGLVFAAAALLAATAGAGAIFGWGAHRASQRAEGSKAVGVADPAGVDAAARRCAQASRKVFGPRMVVAHVADAVWHEAVLAFAAASAVVLVDVSEPTPNLLWEIRALDEHGTRRVLIGRHERLTPLDPMLAGALDGEEILAYGDGRRAMARFARALGASLDREIR